MKIPENVKKDAIAYRGQVQRFLDGQMNPIMFKAYRVPMGIYEQRVSGAYMVRIRVPAGIITAEQAAMVGRLSKQFGNGIVHVTTRQDLQIHSVAIERTPDVLEQLLEAGLSTRGGGGNTVRNISACPKAGLCRNEIFDVSGYATALTEFLVSQNESFNLPRKFKIAFSGCAKDCAFASIADLGFFAEVRDGVGGFAVYAGGGLGAVPAVAVQIEEFISVNDIFETALAVRNLFDKYGDRVNRNRARLRFVLQKLGRKKFIETYKAELAAVKTLGLSFKTPLPQLNNSNGSFAQSAPIARGVRMQKQQGLYSVRLFLKLGDIPADDLIKVSELASKFCDDTLRTTQSQELLLINVPQKNIDSVLAGLKLLSVDALNLKGPKLIACTGAATCKLGLCLSRNLATEIDDQIDKSHGALRDDIDIRISGCPNACGGHFIADIGLQGRATRVNGQLMPAYDILVGGSARRDGAKIGVSAGSLPARAVPAFIVEALSV
ncbi:MAG: nitrite/sulfite reductase, partial [Sedimentisphaerales bacterium]|nr:nitrite/sulfite reductase [Sedimentisphaerales bacterium]